jgi:hypothetical protein
MITLKFKRHPQLTIGCRVKAIHDTEWYKIGSEGFVENRRKNCDGEIIITVKFDRGKYMKGNDSTWLGPKSDFIIVE